MAKYEVSANDAVFGIYVAENEQHARDICARDAGYDSEAEMIDSLERPSELRATEVEEWSAWVDGNKDDTAVFTVPVYGTIDIAEAGARALGIDVGPDLNVERVF
jgi:hypothetical protein